MILTPETPGQRLDQYLVDQLHGRSRAEIQRWIKEGLVTVGGAPARASLRLETGMVVRVEPPEQAAPAALQPQAIPLSIVYEDDDLIVVDKPAGMVVHPAPGHEQGTLVNAVLAHAPDLAGVGGEKRPGLVHRLDRETSGLIVVAKSDAALRNLQAQFKARAVYKEYIALVEGGVVPPEGIINAPVGRHPADRKRHAVLPADARTGETPGREAITEYHTLARYQHETRAGLMAFTLLQVILHTGRTHQIRVHFAWRKHPVVGDTLYGPRTPRLPLDRTFLHAHKLRLRLPSTGEQRTFEASLPTELQALLESLAS